MPHLQPLIHKSKTLLLVLLALGAIAYGGPLLVTHVTPSRLATLDQWVDAIWWPATALRLLACAVLAGWVYPRWVLAQARATRAALAEPPPPADDPQALAAREALQARARHFERAAQRGPWVFGGLLAIELLIAQGPYWLIRG